MRAIILAAGMGTRLRPLTSDRPKALVEVNGEPMLERQIKFLQETGIKDITVVTGYLHEKFDYLTEKYGVELVYNDKYDVYNNFYTMYLVRHLLPGAYIIEGDIYMHRNILEHNQTSSAYFCALRPSFENEWKVVTDDTGRVTDIEIGDGVNDYILSGVSYWSKEDGEFIVSKLEEAIQSTGFENIFWDDIVRVNFQNLNVYLNKLQETDVFEIDSVADHQKVENTIKNL